MQFLNFLRFEILIICSSHFSSSLKPSRWCLQRVTLGSCILQVTMATVFNSAHSVPVLLLLPQDKILVYQVMEILFVFSFCVLMSYWFLKAPYILTCDGLDYLKPHKHYASWWAQWCMEVLKTHFIHFSTRSCIVYMLMGCSNFVRLISDALEFRVGGCTCSCSSDGSELLQMYSLIFYFNLLNAMIVILI